MKSQGATIAATGWKDQLSAWFMHHQQTARSTLSDLAADPVASLMTWLVIGIALALPAILFVVLQNVSTVSGDWGGQPRVSIYLHDHVSLTQARQLQSELAGDALVQQVVFISADDALKEFRHRSGFGAVLSSLDRNPLPHLLEIVPATSEPLEISAMVDRYRADEHVDRVSVDLQWLERLFAILSFSQRLVTAFGIVLALGVLLVMGNTIRLAIENRRQEIEVVKLVGGTDAFVRRPFLYLGFWYGVGGALIAFLLVQVSLLVLSAPVEVLAQSYRDDFALQGPGWAGNLLLLVTGGLLGVLGSLLAVSRHLAEIEPS